MTDSTMTARRRVRLAVKAALEAANLGCQIQSPGDWETPSDQLPSILMRASSDRKTATTAGQTTFTTTVSIEIEARLEANTAERAQDDLEALSHAIECAVLTNYDLTGIVQKFVSVDTVIEITAGGRRHLGGVAMTFLLEVFEVFDPVLQSPIQPVAVPLTEVQINKDGVVGIDITLPQ
jgi:hypothetical protein